MACLYSIFCVLYSISQVQQGASCVILSPNNPVHVTYYMTISFSIELTPSHNKCCSSRNCRPTYSKLYAALPRVQASEFSSATSFPLHRQSVLRSYTRVSVPCITLLPTREIEPGCIGRVPGHFTPEPSLNKVRYRGRSMN